ncbi:PilS N terminal [Achromobacter sp. 2789STDY5608633]|uniref:type 4 pilus major pilin n=1 Tax=Pseudomonadota TaxID=1224 RepID=UPI0006C46161|nr:type 4 pilus major pilin [Achromobacter sp. 2789STDY5608633]CUJ50806.1 PilS N terminal [Achromobacter sp. 2789STDY5608633]
MFTSSFAAQGEPHNDGFKAVASRFQSATRNGGANSRPSALSRRLSVRRSRDGATLLEMGFWLLIFVAIIGSVLGIASVTMRQSTVATEVQTITNLSGVISRMRTSAGYDTATGAIVKSLDDMKMIPANISKTVSGNNVTIRNGWNGAITVNATDGGGNFSITYTQIPREDCVQLVTGTKPGILQSVGSGTTATVAISSITATSASTMCAAAANTVTWDTSSR